MTRLLGMALAAALLALPASAQEEVTTEVVEAEFALQLLVVALDSPA